MRFSGWGLVWLLALVSPAGANDERENELTRWVPSFAMFFDMLGNRAEGTVTTTNVLGPPLPAGGCEVTVAGSTSRNGGLCPDALADIAVTPNTASDDTNVAPAVGGSLELMTPRLVDTALSPRLFTHVDAAAAFGFERNLAGERKPGTFFADPLGTSEFDIAERSINGQGSRAILQVHHLVVGAGGGFVVTTNVFGRTLRMKPSFEYLRQEVDLIGSVRRAVKQVDPADEFPREFRLIELSAEDEEVLHAIGGGLEVEVDSGRLGPLVMSVFAMGRGYRLNGNLNHTLRDANEFGEAATWRFEIDPVLWRAGVGARFRWLPD